MARPPFQLLFLIKCIVCSLSRARMLMLGQRHDVHIASLLVLSPVDVICHLGFRIEFNTLENVLHEFLVSPQPTQQHVSLSILPLAFKERTPVA